MSGLAGLRNYEQQKFAITGILRAASVLAGRDNREWGERLQDLFRRLAEDRFNLVLVGRFSRGKTSLMNAIMGMDRLPTGIVPITSVITSVAYGSKEKLVISYQGRSLDSEISLDQLPQYITQQGNPGNVRGVKLAEVRLPAEILRSGFYFVDTPGLGSAIIENTRTTEAFLPEADALLLVTSYDSPLSSEEMDFIRAASHSTRPLFVVLNKLDTISLAERENALGFVREQIAEATGASPQIFSVSARDGLEAKLCQDPPMLAASGVPALEQELIGFMLTRKETEFLAHAHERAARLLQDLPASLEKERLLGRLRDLGGGLKQEVPTASGMQSAVLSAAKLQIRPCEICAQVVEAQQSFLRRFQYDVTYSEDAQRRLAESHGFCSFHTRQFEAISSQPGLSMGYPALLEHLARELRKAFLAREQPARIGSKFHALLPSRNTCMLCGVRAKAEADAIAAAARKLSEHGAQALTQFSAICLPHLAMLPDSVPSPELIGALAERQAQILERLAEDLRRYALKWNALRGFMMSAEEMAAAQSAINMLVGHREVGFAIAPAAENTDRRGNRHDH
jgi:small GTP-binding protein